MTDYVGIGRPGEEGPYIKPEHRAQAKIDMLLFGNCFVTSEGDLIRPEDVRPHNPINEVVSTGKQERIRLMCSFCNREIKDEHEVRVKRGLYIRHAWCHAAAIRQGGPR